MRCDVRVGGEDVLAIVLTDVGNMKFKPETISAYIARQGIGHVTNMTKDFLMHGCEDTTIKRGCNARKRKCVAMMLSKLDQQHVNQLIHGMTLTVNVLNFFANWG